MKRLPMNIITRFIFVALVLGGPTMTQAPLTALWTLDESTGTTAADGSINGNHGTLFNFGATPWAPAVFGNGLTFDGLDDYVDCMTAGGLPLHGTGNAYSVTGWVNGIAQNDKRIYSEGSAFSNTPLVTIGSGQANTAKIRIYIRNDANQQWGRETTSDVFDGTWHHFAWVTDGVGGARMYIDGNLDATDFNGYVGGTFTTDRVSLGAVLRATTCCFMNGMLDDVRAYPFELTGNDVALIMGNATLGTGYQMNQAAASLDVDGQVASVSSAGRANIAQGASFDLNLSTTLGGFPWELASVTTPAVPNALVLDPGNIVNMPVGGATLANGFFSTTWGSPLGLPGFPSTGYTLSTSLSFTAPASPMFLTVQFGMLDPAAAGGYSVSGATEINVQ